MGLRDQIMQASDLKTEVVHVPEWGCDVTVSEMSGLDRDAFEQSLMGPAGERDVSNLRARLLVKTLRDENGARMFADDEAHFLGAKSASALDRCFAVAQRLNALGAPLQEAVEKN